MKVLKWILIVLALLAVVLFGFFKWAQSNTKKHSPEEIVKYAHNDAEYEVFYNRPFKKDRVIFGELVPYGEVWRTGANEATTFTTSVPLAIMGESLPAGKYSLWTIPGAKEWTVIFNDKMYSWGVGFDGKASHEAEYDVVKVNVPTTKLSQPVEQFTIEFNQSDSATHLLMLWDDVKVSVPLDPAS